MMELCCSAAIKWNSSRRALIAFSCYSTATRSAMTRHRDGEAAITCQAMLRSPVSLALRLTSSPHSTLKPLTVMSRTDDGIRDANKKYAVWHYHTALSPNALPPLRMGLAHRVETDFR